MSATLYDVLKEASDLLDKAKAANDGAEQSLKVYYFRFYKHFSSCL